MTRKRKKHTAMELSAYHEAGHVVMTYLLKRQFRCATIDSRELDKEASGHIFLKPLKTLSLEGILDYSFTRIQKSIEQEVKIALAGEVAEAILLGRNDWISAKKDIQHCYDLCHFQCRNKEQYEAYLKWIWLCVRDMLKLPCNWICVQSVVRALLKYRRISYRKARAIIAEARDNYYKRFTHQQQSQPFLKRLKFTLFHKTKLDVTR
jgi:hypothetical protein